MNKMSQPRSMKLRLVKGRPWSSNWGTTRPIIESWQAHGIWSRPN